MFIISRYYIGIVIAALKHFVILDPNSKSSLLSPVVPNVWYSVVCSQNVVNKKNSGALILRT